MRTRPAESLSLAAAVAYLLAYKLDRLDDPTLLVALTVAIGSVPAVVTWIVEKARRNRAGE